MQLPLRFGAPVGGRARFAVAVAAARGVASASRAAGHHASAIPGFVAERIDPDILRELGARYSPIVLVIGTNGKTTTTRLLATILERALGRRPVSNRSGANLAQGIVTAMLGAGSTTAEPVPAVFEVDELAFVRVAAVLRPDVVVILNLVRDQLDRYGEVDMVERRVAEALRSLPADSTIVACADDPRLESLVSGAGARVRWFGLTDERETGGRPGAAQPSASASAVRAPCPRCGGPTDVDDASASIGAWQCSACGHRRGALELGVRIAGSDDGWLGLAFEHETDTSSPEGRSPAVPPRDLGQARVRLAGTAGAHDAAAAALGAMALGLDPDAVIEAIDGATPAFGRLEELTIGDRTVVLSLAKNPSSVAQATEAAAIRRPDWLLLGLGDRAADGRDVSWIWDAQLDPLVRVAPLTLTGTRADDLALRFKYADGGDHPTHEPIVDESIEHALADALGRIRPGGTLMVLATYTTLLRIRLVLERNGLAAAMPV